MLLGVQADGTKDILASGSTEGAKFWVRVMNELKNRDVNDVLIVVVDGLKVIHRAMDAEAAKGALEAFDSGPWGQKISRDRAKLAAQLERVIPFFAFPGAVRRIIYTTNAIEALNAKLRCAVRTRSNFPTDEAPTKLLFQALRDTARQRKMPPRECSRHPV
jgi:putative transposase